MFYAPQYSFCISLVFMPAWSRDNPYQIITFDCTDDIHLHYFCQSLPSSGQVKGLQVQLLSEPRFRANLVT